MSLRGFQLGSFPNSLIIIPKPLYIYIDMELIKNLKENSFVHQELCRVAVEMSLDKLQTYLGTMAANGFMHENYATLFQYNRCLPLF